LVTTKFIDIDQNHCLAAKYQQISMVKIGVERNSEKDRQSENYYEVQCVIAGICKLVMQIAS
jgi:hypothetical protein